MMEYGRQARFPQLRDAARNTPPMKFVRPFVVAALVATLVRSAVADDSPSIRGVVRDITRRPVACVPVRCTGVSDVTTDAVTDTEGRFEIRGLKRGETWIALLAESGVGDDAERTLAWSAPVEQDFVIHGELDLSGRVITKEEGPFVLELDWNADAGAGAWGSRTARRLTLPPDGSFGFTALRAGTYTLRVAKDGLARSTQQVELFTSASGFQVTLPTVRRASFAVRVVAAWPEASSFTSVWLRPESAGREDTLYGEPRDDVFHFEHVVVGRYWAQVRHVFGDEPETSVSRDRWFPLDVGDATGPATVTCVPAEDVRVTLVPPKGRSFIEGRVVAASGPFESVTKFEMRRAPDGRVSIWKTPDRSPGLPPGLRKEPVVGEALPLPDQVDGPQRIRVEALGVDPIERTFTVTGPTRLEIALPGLAGGEVAMADGVDKARVQHLRVDARRDEPEANWVEVLWWRLWPRESHGPIPGTFRAFLSPGRYRFRATCERYADTEIGPIEIAADGPLVRLSPSWHEGVAVSGRVLLHGLPVHDGWVYPQRLEGGRWRSLAAKEVFIEHGGAYRVAGLSPGRYRFAGTSRRLPILGEIEVADRDVYLDLVHPSVLSPAKRSR